MSSGQSMTIRRARRALLTLGVPLAWGCEGDDIVAPSCDRCDELRILSDRSEYPPGALVRFTITNLAQQPLTYDWCSITLSSRTTEAPFEVIYAPSKRCGQGAGIEQVLEHLQTIEPGQSRRDSLIVTSAAFQGQRRIHLWLVNTEGIPEEGDPVTSNIFLILPGADQALTHRN